MKTKYLFFTLIILLFFVTMSDVDAQCAMCRSSVESNITNQSSSIGLGLNKGILYLLSLPYLMIAGVGYLWYKNSSLQKPKKFDFQWKKS
jgi:hypothetical protein